VTPIDFRKKKALEIQDLLNKLSSLDDTNYSSENKDRLFRTYQAQIERLDAILTSSSLQRLCSSRDPAAGERPES
jgi:hypothetical protein